MFDSNTQPKYLEKEEWIVRDVHCIPSLIKLFFRELPSSPLQAMTNNNNNNNMTTTTYGLLRSAVSSANLNSDKRDALRDFKNALELLSSAQFWSVLYHCAICCALSENMRPRKTTLINEFEISV